MLGLRTTRKEFAFLSGSARFFLFLLLPFQITAHEEADDEDRHDEGN
jgi:hypothetical protein